MKLKFTDSPVASYISELDINGLKGRMLDLPAKDPKTKREILFVYGVHTTIERVASTAQFLSNYGHVTIPDLPGFGGMDTFYTIDLEPTIDNYADYLAAFIKLRYKNKRITLVGMSFGFAVITRMLQRYPELVNRVDLLVSLVGFSNGNEFVVSPFYKLALKTMFVFMAHNPSSWFIKSFILRKKIVGLFYTNHHAKLKNASKAERNTIVAYETYLWQCNELKTYGNVMLEVATFSQPDIKVNLTLHHMGTDNDQWLSNQKIIENLQKIFTNVKAHKAHMDNHGASLITEESDIAAIVPQSIRKLLK